MSNAYSSNKTQSSSNTTNMDNRVTSSSGDIMAVTGSTIDNAGGTLTFNTANAELASNAIDAVSGIAAKAYDSAKAVVDSQANFVAEASGNKLTVYLVGGIAALLLIPALLKK